MNHSDNYGEISSEEFREHFNVTKEDDEWLNTSVFICPLCLKTINVSPPYPDYVKIYTNGERAVHVDCAKKTSPNKLGEFISSKRSITDNYLNTMYDKEGLGELVKVMCNEPCNTREVIISDLRQFIFDLDEKVTDQFIKFILGED